MKSVVLFILVSLSISSAFTLTSSSLKINNNLNQRYYHDDSTSLYSSSSNTNEKSKPELPEIKGDYNWDEKFATDPEWITENIPGKTVLNQLELAAQVSALSKLEDKYRKERLAKEYDEARILGWTSQAEMYNGRFAMFFLVVGLLTEYWTGISLPGQIEEILRVGGFIGPDY